jgi:hypothetical protein
MSRPRAYDLRWTHLRGTRGGAEGDRDLQHVLRSYLPADVVQKRPAAGTRAITLIHARRSEHPSLPRRAW